MKQLLCVTLILVLAAVPGVVLAQDDDEEETVSPEGEFAGTDEPGEPRKGIGFLHPSYSVNYGVDRDVQKWSHNFNLSQPFGSSISLDSKVGITRNENAGFDRVTTNENWNTGLSFNPAQDFSLRTSFSRKLYKTTTEVGIGSSGGTRNLTESFAVSAEYNKPLIGFLESRIKGSGGLSNTDHTGVRGTSRDQGLETSLSYSPFKEFSMKFDYSGKQSFVDYEGLGRDSERADSKISSRISYDSELLGAVNISLDRSNKIQEYPVELDSIWQVESRTIDQKSVSVSSQMNPGNIQLSVNYLLSNNQTDYALGTFPWTDVTKRNLSADLTYKLWGVTFRGNFGRQKSRDKKLTKDSGLEDQQDLGGSMSFRLGSRTNFTFRGNMSLFSYFYDDPEHDLDRDLYGLNGSFSVTHKINEKISMKLDGSYNESRDVYVRASRSSQNKTAESFNLNPSYIFNVNKWLKLEQTFALIANYTFYHFDDDQNALIRYVKMNTSADLKPLPKLTVGISHSYSYYDQGSYTEDDRGVESFGRTGENVEQDMNIKVTYRPSKNVSLGATQKLSIDRRWDFNSETNAMEFQRQNLDTSFSANISFSFRVADGSTLRADVRKSNRYAEGRNLRDADKDFWHASVTVSKTF
jgi:hypothetical protein